jgi:hypothetical protein
MGITVVPSAVTGQTLTAAQWNTQVRDNINGIWVLTTGGDMLYATGASAAARLAIGTVNQIMRSTGSAPAWAEISSILAAKAIVASQTAGDIFYATGAASIGRTAKTNGGLMYHNGTAPVYLSPVSGGLMYHNGTAPVYLSPGSNHKFLRTNGSGLSWQPIIFGRRGGSATDWSTPGTTSYTPTAPFLQVGVVALSISSGAGASTVTFPTAYASGKAPVVFPVLIGTLSKRRTTPRIYSLSNTGFSVHVYDIDGEDETVAIGWLAIGESA